MCLIIHKGKREECHGADTFTGWSLCNNYHMAKMATRTKLILRDKASKDATVIGYTTTVAP